MNSALQKSSRRARISRLANSQRQFTKFAVVGLAAFRANRVDDVEIRRPGIDLSATGTFDDVTLLAVPIPLQRILSRRVQVQGFKHRQRAPIERSAGCQPRRLPVDYRL